MYLALKKMIVEPDRKWNRSNAYRVARKKGIGNPRELTLCDVLDGLHYCRIQMSEARKRATQGREEMLRDWLASAVEKEDKKKISNIKSIMNGEKGRRNWSIINMTVDDPRPPPITEIGREEGGEIVWYSNEAGVHKVFPEECEARYNLARKSPAMKTSLAKLNEADDMDLDMAMSLINGSVPLPDDLDEPTMNYIREFIDTSASR